MRVYLRAVSYFRQDAGLIVLLVALIACSVGLGLLQAWPMAILVDAVLTSTPKNDFIHRLFLAPLPESMMGRIVGVTLIGMLMKIVQDTLRMVRTMLNYRIRYNGTTRVREQLYARLQWLGLPYHKTRPQGDAIYRLSNDTAGPYGILDTIIETLVASVTLLAMIGIMLTRSVWLTVFALSIAPLLIFLNFYFGRRIRHGAAASKQADTFLTTVVQRAMASIGLMQAFNRQSLEGARFRTAVDNSVGAALKLNWQEALYPLSVQIVFALGGAVIFGYGGYLVYQDQFVNRVPNGVSCGDLMVFMAYLGQLWDPLSAVAGCTARIQPHVAASERVLAVLDEKVKVVEAPGALSLPLQPRQLALEDVGFEYAGGEEILRGIDAVIPAGAMVAFVGSSGAGKSTLLSLLPRFFDPTRGCVRLDGHDLRELSLATVRGHVAVVSQDCGLLAGSIRENIAYGNLHASEAEIRRAAEAAGAAKFIAELPEGYETQVAEGGQNLSGGQRQRLCIARALLTGAPILVLDEPTSALDAETEQLVMQTLNSLKGQRTVVLVTHRLETTRECDEIYVLERGRLAERRTLSLRERADTNVVSAG